MLESEAPPQEQSADGGNNETELCLVPGCPTGDLSQLSRYHQRHRVCQFHLKAAKVQLDGGDHRFCQQCGRFQPLADFREDRRSCKAALRAHNARRRHSSMASDNAIYQGRFRSNNKRSLLSAAARGPSSSAGRRCLDRSAGSSNSQHSAPALLQGHGDGSTRRLRSSSEWQGYSDGACTGEQQALSESPDASYASAVSDEDEPTQPRRRPRTKQQPQQYQQAYLEYRQQYQTVPQHHEQGTQHQMMMHLPGGYMQQHSMQDWHSGSGSYSPPIAQFDALRPLQCSQGLVAMGCADPASMMQHGLAGHMLPAAHPDLAGGFGGHAAPHGPCRLGQAAAKPAGAVSAGMPAAGAGVAGWQQGYAGSAHHMAAPGAHVHAHANTAPGWQQQGSPPAGQQQLSTQGFPAGFPAGMLPGWHGGGVPTPAQQLLSALSAQSCASASTAPAWQQQQQQGFAPPLQHCVPGSTTHAHPAAAGGGSGWQLGSLAAVQQLAAAATHGYTAPGMAPEWRQVTSAMQPQLLGAGPGSLPVSTGALQAPMQSAGLPVGTHGGAVPLPGHLWAWAGSGSSTQQHAQLQQSTIGHIGWPAAAPQPSFPQAPAQPQLRASSAPPAQQPIGGPSAAYTYLQRAMAQAAPLQHQQQQGGGLGLAAQQQGPAASAPDQDGSTQTLFSQARQGPPSADPALVQQADGRPDWLDVLACSEDMDGAEDVPRMGLSPSGAALAASTAPPALRSHACRQQGGLLPAGRLAAAAAAAGAVDAPPSRCFSPEGCLLDGLEEAADGELPSEEVDALLDQALDDLFHVQPGGRAVPACCISSSRAPGGPAGVDESLPCHSTTCDGQR